MQLTYAMLLQILVEAEARRDDKSLPREVRARSAETVDLCNQRMKNEGVTIVELKKLAKAEEESE